MSLHILTCWCSSSIFLTLPPSWPSCPIWPFSSRAALNLPDLRCFTLTKRHTPPPGRARPNHSSSCYSPPSPPAGPVTAGPVPAGPPSSVTAFSVAPPGPSVGRGPPVGVKSWKKQLLHDAFISKAGPILSQFRQILRLCYFCWLWLGAHRR